MLFEAPEQFLRHAGWAMIYDRQSGQTSFVKRLGEGHYPRLHLYFADLGERISFSLHLDQKKASYEGQARHSVEYDGPVVEEEVKRLRALVERGEKFKEESQSLDPIRNIKGNYYEDGQPESKKSWFKRLLGL